MAASISKSPFKTSLSSARNDGRIFLSFSDDDMEAFADFFPAAFHGKPLDMDYAKSLLERLNIQHGVFWDHIENTIRECNASGKPVKKVLIARGNIPVDEVNEYFRLEDSARKAPPRFEEGAQTNYRAFSPYIIVQQGQCLASLRAAVAGIRGRTVHGDIIEYKSALQPSLSAGKNTRIEGNKIFSDIAGQLVIKKNLLQVEPNLVITGAVGYATGDINFPGDVVLAGAVNDGFRISTGASLMVREKLDVTDVIVKKDLIVSGGMIGRGRALVKVSGNVKARFVQNCRLACKKSVSIAAEIINSTVYTMESVDLGSKGTILGGEIFAFNSIIAGRVGKERSSPVKIRLGVDWTLRQEIEQNHNLMRMIRAKLAKTAEYHASPEISAAQKIKLGSIVTRLKDEYEKCELKKIELEKRYIVNPHAYLSCAYSVAEGTIVEICGVELVITEPLKKVRLALDETTGRITML